MTRITQQDVLKMVDQAIWTTANRAHQFTMKDTPAYLEYCEENGLDVDHYESMESFQDNWSPDEFDGICSRCGHHANESKSSLHQMIPCGDAHYRQECGESLGSECCGVELIDARGDSL